MKHFFVAAFLFLSAGAGAQQYSSNTVLPIVGGEYPKSNEKYASLRSGTPFFQDEWVKARLIAPGGIVYKDVDVKVNLIDDRIHFLDEKGKELLIKETLNEIELFPNARGKKFYFINGNILPVAKKGWHQLLVNDSITLLKSFTKTVIEHKSYGSPIEYSIETVDDYTVVYNKQAYNVKKPADLLEVLPSKRAEVEANIKNLNKKMSREEQLVAVVTYMNMID